MSKQKLTLILGPTALGKAALSLKLTKKFNGEIVSADSRQIYINVAIYKKLDLKTIKDIQKKEGKSLFWLVERGFILRQ
jgi:tRNA dimethylallyltransferase